MSPGRVRTHKSQQASARRPKPSDRATTGIGKLKIDCSNSNDYWILLLKIYNILRDPHYWNSLDFSPCTTKLGPGRWNSSVLQRNKTESYKLRRFFDLKKIQLTSDVDGLGNKSGSQTGEYKTENKLRQYRPGGHKRESEILLLYRLITGYKQWQCITGPASNIWLTWDSGLWDWRGDINKWGISVLCVCTSQWSLCIPVTYTHSVHCKPVFFLIITTHHTINDEEELKHY